MKDMKKSTIILIVVLVLIALVFAGVFTSIETCNSFRCEYRIFGILYKTVTNPQLIGGCGGVYYTYWNECCENWANENEIVHAQCVGNWSVENSVCKWDCN